MKLLKASWIGSTTRSLVNRFLKNFLRFAFFRKSKEAKSPSSLTLLKELEGLQAGGADAGYPLAGRYIQRGILLANFPGDVEDIVYVLEELSAMTAVLFL